MAFDPLTILLLLVISSLFVFIFLIIYYLSGKNRNPVILIYAIGKLIFVLAYVFLAYRDSIPLYVSIIAGNGLLFVAVAMEVFCISSTHLPYTRKRLLFFLIPTLIFSLVFYAFIRFPDNIRIAIATWQPAIYMMLGSILLMVKSGRSSLKIFLSVLYFITSVSYIGRFFIAVFRDHSLELHSYNMVQIFSYIFLFFLTYMDVIFILISLKEQDEEKIREINKVIQRDNKLLKELNTVKDKFFSIIAHDLKTPIGSLSSLLGVLTENDSDMEPERRHKLLKTVYTNSKNTYHLLNNLLLWARSESGQTRYNPARLELNKLIDRNIELLKSGADIKRIRIDSVADDLTVIADHDMLDAVIRNLLSNAIKFTGEEGRIWFTADTHTKGYYKIGIHDNGTGIEKEVIHSLFNLDSEYIRKGTNNEKGTGLGLKLCREFIKKNEGDIWVESEPGKGSVFYFTVRKG